MGAGSKCPMRADSRILVREKGINIMTGAYAKLSAHPSDLISVIRHGLLEHTQSIHRLFNLEYHLSRRDSGKPVHPFLAALLDAIAGYTYLTNEVGFSPDSIIVIGDSAGGNLAIALVRYLLERHALGDTDVPGVPSALLLFSPWVDLAVRKHEPGSSALRNRHITWKMRSRRTRLSYQADRATVRWGEGRHHPIWHSY